MKKLPRPGFEPGSSRPQRDVLTTRPSKHLTSSTPLRQILYPHCIAPRDFFYDVTTGGMGGHPPSRDHVSLGVTSRHVGQIGSYIICEHWEGSSHQDLSCS